MISSQLTNNRLVTKQMESSVRDPHAYTREMILVFHPVAKLL